MSGKIATASVRLAVSGDGVTFTYTTPTMTNATSPFEHQPVTLASGANTITPPTGTTMVLVVPPTTSTVTKTLKGVTGDTGLPLSMTAPTFLSLASAASFCVTANGTETVSFYFL